MDDNALLLLVLEDDGEWGDDGEPNKTAELALVSSGTVALRVEAAIGSLGC